MRFLLAFLFVLAFYSANASSEIVLSGEAEISILTCAPGNLLYESFGHSALRVNDPGQGMDIVFNYGIFDFGEGFIGRFIQGDLKYKLGISSFAGFMRVYLPDDRSIEEQVLNLDSTQRQKLFDFLIWNERPENRYYQYDYFRDNCASRLRDVVDEHAGIEVQWNDTFETQNESYRSLMNHYGRNNPWGLLGINICLGMPIDKKLSNEEYSFLPDYLRNSFSLATLTNGEKLVKKHRFLHRGVPRNAPPWYTTPQWIVCLLLIVMYIFISQAGRQGILVLDYVLFGSLFLLSAVLLYLWFFTSHADARYNLSLLWVSPFYPFIYMRRNVFAKVISHMVASFGFVLLIVSNLGDPYSIAPSVAFLVCLIGFRISITTGLETPPTIDYSKKNWWLKDLFSF